MNAQPAQARGIARTFLWLLVLVAALATGYVLIQSTPATSRLRVALVTADADPYWDRVVEGATAAARELSIDLSVIKADGSLDGQTSIMLGLLDKGFDGIAVSPVDAVKQGVALRRVAASSRLITVDSDSLLSGRLCFVGADNYAMGRAAGELVKAALPEGGRVVILSGPINKANGERRRQGLIDELLDRSFGPGRPTEPLDEVHTSAKYTVTATLIDQIDPAEAERNLKAALEADPSINAVIGLYAYSAPAAVNALRSAGATDRVKVIGFDDREETLAGLADGSVYATIAQDQFNYGYHTVRLLADIAQGRADVAIPLTENIHFPPLTVTSENLDDYKDRRR